MGELTHEGGFGCLLYGGAGREKIVKRMWLYGTVGREAEQLVQNRGGLCYSTRVVAEQGVAKFVSRFLLSFYSSSPHRRSTGIYSKELNRFVVASAV
jgi:hypothetical protein